MKTAAKLSLFAALTLTPSWAVPILLPLPGHSSVFTGNVRGYWFEAPVDFSIVGLFIPTDASSANMNIELLRLNSPPPLFSTTTNDFVSLFRTIDDASVDFVPVSIQVMAGDIIGVLGQRGTANSYGNGNFVTDIFGQSVTLRRLGQQFVLADAPAHDVWTESSGSISRVQIQYDLATTVPEPATLWFCGAGLAAIALRRKLLR